MNLQRIIPCIACMAILSGCATTNSNAPPKSAALTVETALAEADAAAKAGQPDKAVHILKTATATHPDDKAPWIQLAQMRFDGGNYGDAIVNALEGLQRDPDDKLGHSIVAVSGLRLSSKALADLSQKNNLSGTVRSEAQDLAKLLRASLGEEVLVPAKDKGGTRAKETVKKQVSVPPLKAAAGNDPFGALK
jgi:predicted Zn-dependent protease